MGHTLAAAAPHSHRVSFQTHPSDKIPPSELLITVPGTCLGTMPCVLGCPAAARLCRGGPSPRGRARPRVGSTAPCTAEAHARRFRVLVRGARRPPERRAAPRLATRSARLCGEDTARALRTATALCRTSVGKRKQRREREGNKQGRRKGKRGRRNVRSRAFRFPPDRFLRPSWNGARAGTQDSRSRQALGGGMAIFFLFPMASNTLSFRVGGSEVAPSHPSPLPFRPRSVTEAPPPAQRCRCPEVRSPALAVGKSVTGRWPVWGQRQGLRVWDRVTANQTSVLPPAGAPAAGPSPAPARHSRQPHVPARDL